jgi:CRP-like cAMP-binding protein/membrane protein YdbS with pleckstrin-like domain
MATQPTIIARDPDKLRAIPLFASLKKNDLAYVAQILKWPASPCASETRIIEQGKENDKFYIIVDGEVKVAREYGSNLIVGLGTLKKYDFFGETGLLKNVPPNATVEAIATTTLFYIEKEQFDEMLARLPGVKQQIQVAAERWSKGMRLKNLLGLDSSEVTLWVARRDVIPLIWDSLPGLAVGNGLAFILAAVAFFSTSIVKQGQGQFVWPWLLGASAVVVFTLVWIWYVVDWTNDYLVLTNQRVIHKEVVAFVREIRQEIPIEAVQDVSLETRGPLFKLLGLADITIETIGGKIKFEYLRDAEDLKDSILSRLDMIKLEAKSVERDAMHQELGRALRPGA